MELKKAQFDIAEEVAYELLDKFNIKKPIVNSFEIAKKLGFEVIFFSPDSDNKAFGEDIAGAIDVKNKKILVNKQDTAERQLFTVAHELGHFVLNHNKEEDILYRSDTLNKPKDPLEQEANFFAASLLVPETMLENICNEYGFKLVRDENKLAQVFGVSLTFMKYRLKHIIKNRIRLEQSLEDELTEGDPFDA
jgi:Zn-dependent peptidase ImmA (M78 family)